MSGFFSELFKAFAPSPRNPQQPLSPQQPDDGCVRRNSQPFHSERGWKLSGDTLDGYYRTVHGAFKGTIHGARSVRPEYFVTDPPPQLLSGPHGICFRPKSKNTFFVHWSRQPDSVDAGIMRIEHYLLEALS